MGLNYLVTGAEAVLAKRWLVKFYDSMVGPGKFKHGWDGDFVIMWHVHDEMGVAVRDGIDPEIIGKLIVQCALRSGEDLGLKIRTDAE